MHSTLFDYLAPTPNQRTAMNALRSSYKRMLEAIEALCPEGRYKSLAITKLEESAMFANKGITRQNDGAPRQPAYIDMGDALDAQQRCC